MLRRRLAEGGLCQCSWAAWWDQNFSDERREREWVLSWGWEVIASVLEVVAVVAVVV